MAVFVWCLFSSAVIYSAAAVLAFAALRKHSLGRYLMDLVLYGFTFFFLTQVLQRNDPSDGVDHPTLLGAALFWRHSLCLQTFQLQHGEPGKRISHF